MKMMSWKSLTSVSLGSITLTFPPRIGEMKVQDRWLEIVELQGKQDKNKSILFVVVVVEDLYDTTQHFD